MRIEESGLDDARVIALLRHHIETAAAETEPGSAHALDTQALRAPGVRFWTIWIGDDLAGTGALKRLADDHGEVKSMHVAKAFRGRGAGAAMLERIIAASREDRLARISLETGSWPYFKPAHALYERFGFVDCAPFASYVPDRNSRFMTLALNPTD